MLPQASCADYSKYNYDDFKSKFSNDHAEGWAANFGAAASAWGWSVGGSGGYSEYFSNSYDFEEAKKSASAYRSSNCGSSDITSANDARVAQLGQLYESGLRVTQTQGWSGRSLALDFWFTPATGGGHTAFVTGLEVVPEGHAKCTLLRADNRVIDPAKPFYFEIYNKTMHTIVCMLTDLAPPDSWTDIYVFTTATGTYHALLFNKISTATRGRLTALKDKTKALRTTLSPDRLTGQLNVKQLCVGSGCMVPEASRINIGNS
ncbi:hypothetical protein HYH03_002651 [Edaphochlamys debaryana]|uniref:Uncharacterized protein n=1 Tax=Edaphochlamys debaryana TaxID=47281 RepID=A0A835YF18_9CHLO|nr:hypothetical protein HYH03_002651 [Edaphochlamys debaryana]|eukprot:KAG2499716.1 hypothetical protein HYH03_002651 [Edaphochlamys debaryana]